MKKRISFDDFSLLLKGDSYVIRKRSSLDAQRIQNGPEFKRTRENNNEFGYACRVAGIIRKAFKRRFGWSTDPKTGGKLTKRVLELVRKDGVRPRGERILEPEHWGGLRWFNLNPRTNVDTLLSAMQFQEEQAGAQKVVYSGRVEGGYLQGLTKCAATHVWVGLVALPLNPEQPEQAWGAVVQSVYLPLDDTIRSFELELDVSRPEGHAVIIGACVSFYQEMGGQQYRMGLHDGVGIVKVL